MNHHGAKACHGSGSVYAYLAAICNRGTPNRRKFKQLVRLAGEDTSQGVGENEFYK